MTLKTFFILSALLLFIGQCYSKEFVIYDSIGQTGKPDLSVYGLKPIKLVHAQFLWDDVKNMQYPEFSKIDSYIETLGPVDTLCLDIEHWHLNNEPRQTIDENIRKLTLIYNRFKQAYPESNIGYYGIFPIRDYWTPVKKNAAKMRVWDIKNQYLNQLASKVDIIFPSLYTFYRDQDGWLTYAKSNIAQARKYNKPVIVFLWPQYHTSNRFSALDFIDYDYWILQLETAYQYADGIVIWTPAGKMKSQWKSDSPWWRATLNFIKTNKLN